MLTEYLSQHGLLGLAIGLCTFLIIGLFHPLVIKGEYYFGVGCRWWFAAAGAVFCTLSYLCDDIFGSTLLGVTGFSSFWSVLEVTEQRERVRKGWFPANPKRKGKQ